MKKTPPKKQKKSSRKWHLPEVRGRIIDVAGVILALGKIYDVCRDWLS